MKDGVLPQVIITNRDLALINALEIVFPSSTNLLCEFHISKNSRAKYKMLVTKAEN